MTDYLRNKPHHPLMAILIMSLLGQGSKSGYLSNNDKAGCNLGTVIPRFTRFSITRFSITRFSVLVQKNLHKDK